MPEAWLHLRWPDQRQAKYYSPSSVIRDHFAAGEDYNVTDFLERARIALQLASDRVKTKFGFACARAGASLSAIEREAEPFTGQAAARIRILEISS